MLNPDWYPRRLAELPPWHARFSAQASLTGLADGLTADIIAEAAIDADSIRKLVNYRSAVEGFAQAYVQFMKALIQGPANLPLPAEPLPPSPIGINPGARTAIKSRTRVAVGMLKAHVDYTREKGELYGIIAPARSGERVPQIRSARAETGGIVTVSLKKDGFAVIAVDMRRHDGAWTQIGVSQTMRFIDATPNLDSGSPEEREYRLQAMVANRRVGPVSATITIVTLP